MSLDHLFRGLSIAGSGMTAQRERMNLVTMNIAHAQDLDRGDGTPYRRREATFQSVLDGEHAGEVRVGGVVDDTKTPLPKVSMPGHPLADAQGYVAMPNVNPVFEMVDLLSASRAYEANVQASRTMKTMMEQALDLGR